MFKLLFADRMTITTTNEDRENIAVTAAKRPAMCPDGTSSHSKHKETIDTPETKTDELAVRENTVVAQPRSQGQRRSQIRKSDCSRRGMLDTPASADSDDKIADSTI